MKLPRAKTQKPRVVPARIDSKAALRKFQRQMLKAVTEPLTPDYETKKITRDGRKFADVAAQFVKPNDRLTSFERLSIYNKQYWFRLLDCLSEDFPGVSALLGDRAFDRMCRAYLEKYPSRSYSLRNLGQHMPRFLREEPRWSGRRQDLLVDMAQFEWAQVEAFDGMQHPVLQIDDLLGANPATLKLTLQPYVTLLALHYPIDDFVLAMKKQQFGTAVEASTRKAITASKGRKPLRTPKREAVYLAIHRMENTLYYKRFDAESYNVLVALRSGRTLEQALRLVPIEGESAAFAEKVRGWFATWTQLGWFCKPTP